MGSAFQMEGAEDAKAILLGRTWAYVGPPGGAAGGGDGDSSGSRFFHKEPRL